MLVLVGLLLAWYSQTRLRDYRENRIQVMQATVDATAANLAQYTANLRRNIELFGQDFEPLLRQLVAGATAGESASEPHRTADRQAAYDRLQRALQTHFPNHFSFTIADADGTPLLQGLDNLVGPRCRRDIQGYARELASHRVYIHPSPDANRYHFDLMVPWRSGSQGDRSGQPAADGDPPDGVFFVSFFADEIARFLTNAEHGGEQLILVREDQPDRIEVTAEGARDDLLRMPILNEDELARVSARASVPNTRWRLYDLPAVDWLDSYRRQVRNEALFVFALFALTALTLLLFVNRSERALRDTNRNLSESLERLRETREHLVQSEKMAALGGLVAGVAHEINTPVGTAITASSHLAEEQQRTRGALDQGILKKSQLQAFIATAEEGTRIILANLQRAAELIKSFKLVASDQAHSQLRQFELCSYLDEVLMSLRPKVKHSAHRISLDCDGEVSMHGYPGAIAQIVTNLLDNALTHAFAEGQAGQFSIEVRPQPVRPPEQGQKAGRKPAHKPPTEQVQLVISDDGRGMDAETVAHAFDPFFTRNRDGGGTGLGLHIVYNLVTGKLGGRIACDSRPGEGTRFTLSLPLAAPAGSDPNP